MSALFDDSAVLKNVDAIGVLNRAESMSDGYGGPPGCRSVKCLLHYDFGVGIER